MAKIWILRLVVLIGLASMVAGADAFVFRPVKTPPPRPAVAAGTPTDGHAPSTNGITLEDTRAAFESGESFFVDARPIAQYAEGHIPGALHIDVEMFRQGRPEALDFLPTDAHIVIYCGGGECDASHMVERMMQSHGYQNLKIFEAGFPAWEKAEYPVETGEPTL
ncbi:hypothetical protein GC173_02000 [bacterium]|nr:hypothetical protein [bacterium]